MKQLRQELLGQVGKNKPRTKKRTRPLEEEEEKEMETEALRGMGIASDEEEEDERALARLLATEVTIPEDDFRLDVPEVFTSVISTADWSDLDPGKRDCYRLYKMKTDQAVAILGDSVFQSIKGKVTAKAICNLMLLAFQLKDNAGNHVFGRISDALIGDTRSFKDESEDVLFTADAGSRLRINVAENDPRLAFKIATGYSYLAASYMRLSTKSPENYVNIRDHLEERFSNFYSFPLPIDNFHPDLQVVKAIRTTFDTNQVLKNTFYNFLYAGENCSYGEQVKEFLYRMHVAHTGMHPYTMFLRCMAAHKVSNKTLRKVLNNPAFEKELAGIATLFNTVHASQDKPGKKLQMWKFARVFDNSFYHDLQTKNCVLFTAVLACIYHNAVPVKKNSNAHGIAGISGMTPQMKLMARGIAGIAVEQITYGNSDVGVEKLVRKV